MVLRILWSSESCELNKSLILMDKKVKQFVHTQDISLAISPTNIKHIQISAFSFRVLWVQLYNMYLI